MLISSISYLFVLLFLYTAVSKILDYNHFKNLLRYSPLLRNSASIVAVFLPAMEILLVLFLLNPRSLKWGLYGSFILMILFTFYVGYMLAFVSKQSLPCSCGGILKQMSWRQHLIFNIAFTSLALVGIWLNRKQFREEMERITKATYA